MWFQACGFTGIFRHADQSQRLQLISILPLKQTAFASIVSASISNDYSLCFL
jgi:hypothetical protein